MKCTWEIKDIVGGKVFGKEGMLEVMQIAWMTGRVARAGTLFASEYYTLGEADGNLWGVSSFSDGMFTIVGSGTREAIVQHLNNNKYIPHELFSDEHKKACYEQR